MKESSNFKQFGGDVNGDDAVHDLQVAPHMAGFQFAWDIGPAQIPISTLASKRLLFHREFPCHGDHDVSFFARKLMPALENDDSRPGRLWLNAIAMPWTVFFHDFQSPTMW